tara:strand:+ start:363 stop:3293 length:2931 start_codon:yes stop_codon:yes gene_type:complete
MAKIKINKLPKGFKLVDGKIVEDKLMRDGGDLRTGDQADYGLVTTPQNYYGETNFNNSRDEHVRYSLSSVPRDNANIEAEGGETVLTDLNSDGDFGLYNITGPRHSKGGVPMFLPEQSFIFSDTPKLKFGKEEMAEFGITGDRKTPATISKKFQLNDYYGELDSQYADLISSTSAELMLKKNMNDLSKLAFMQEAKKGFEDGVPLASHPYLLSVGIDPLEFTAKMEAISEEEARQRAIAALTPEQQEQLMMLQAMIAQAEQAPPAQGGSPEGPEQVDTMPLPPGSSSNPFDEMQLADANNAMMDTARFGSELSDFMRKAQEGPGTDDGKKVVQEGTYSVNGQNVDRATYIDYMIRNNMHRGSMDNPMSGEVNPSFLADLTDDEKRMYAKALQNIEDFDYMNKESYKWDGDLSVSDEEFATIFPNAAANPNNNTNNNNNADNSTDTDNNNTSQTSSGSTRYKNPYPEGSDNYNKLQKYIDDDRYDIRVVDGRIRIFKDWESKFDTDEKRERKSSTDQQGSGSVPIYSEDIEGQGQVLEGSPIGQYQYGILSEGNRPLNQKKSSAGSYGSADIMSEEAAADFEMRWGDVTSQIDGWDYNAGANHPQWAQFQKLAEETRRKEAEAIGIPYVPYFKEKGSEGYVKGEGFDGALGLHTFNTPRLNVDITSQEELFMDLPEEPVVDRTPPVVEDPGPAKEWWAQDINNVTSMNFIEDDLLLPWAPELERQKIDYVLDDWTGAVNANTAAQAVMAQALGAYGPQALSRSNIQGKTLDANAKAINKVNQNNVKTMNQVAALQPQLDLQVDRLNAIKDTKLYDDTNVALQNAQNFSNWKTAKTNELYNQGITNASNTYNLNQLYDYYNIDPRAGGDVVWTEDGRALYKDNQVNRQEKFLDDYADLRKNLPPDQEISPKMLEYYMGLQNNTLASNTTVGQNELSQRGIPGYPGSNVNLVEEEDGKKGKEMKMKKWAMPFYSGKMGI